MFHPICTSSSEGVREIQAGKGWMTLATSANEIILSVKVNRAFLNFNAFLITNFNNVSFWKSIIKTAGKSSISSTD